jgi:hypothetical protein
MMATHTTKGYQESCASFQTTKRSTPRDIIGGTGNVCAYIATAITARWLRLLNPRHLRYKHWCHMQPIMHRMQPILFSILHNVVTQNMLPPCTTIVCPCCNNSRLGSVLGEVLCQPTNVPIKGHTGLKLCSASGQNSNCTLLQKPQDLVRTSDCCIPSSVRVVINLQNQITSMQNMLRLLLKS